jgi:hypothetical protein
MIDKLQLKNKLTNGHDLTLAECDYLKRLIFKEEEKSSPDKNLTTWDYCPSCAGELDTGFECLKCGEDWRPLVILNPLAVEVVSAAVAWHESGQEGGSDDWLNASERLTTAIDNLLQAR